MKRIIEIALLTSILSIIAGCSKEEPNMCTDYETFTFKHTYLRYFQDKEIFFVKGMVLNINKHGCEINVIEDLNGNFAGKSSIFVWGSTGILCGNKERHDARIDDLSKYQQNDTLIMFIEKASKRFNGDIESTNDYTILKNYSSVVKLSNGYVSGYINNWGVAVLWEELQNELQTRLKSYEKPPLWSEELIPDPFYIAYKGIERGKWVYPVAYNENKNYHFIKGFISDYCYNDGIKIEIINDFTGNFPEETKNAIVWGKRSHSSQFLSNRLDDLKLYNCQDTLLMLLRQVSMEDEISSNSIEKREDYSTLYSAFSVLKLSKNNVTGLTWKSWGVRVQS